MVVLTLNRSPDEATDLVKLAFEHTEGIKTYHDSGGQITGKTGASLFSWGERVTVTVLDHQPDPPKTQIEITSDREVSVNFTADPDQYEQEFKRALQGLRNRPPSEIRSELADLQAMDGSKEVATAGDQAAGKVYR